MARLTTTLWMLWAPDATARAGRVGLPPAWLLLLLRTALPIVPNLSDTLATWQGGEHWLRIAATMAA